MRRFVLAVGALAVALACGLPGSDLGEGSIPQGIPVEIASLELDAETRSPVLLLREIDGDRELPIWIGEFEAQSIAMEIHGIEPVRPNPHDMAREIVARSGGRVDRVVVNDLRDGVFYARIVVVSESGAQDIDARPSDAIALAVRAGAPIQVRASVFERAGRTRGFDSPPTDRQVPSRSL